MILDLHRQGASISSIARQVGLDRKTVRRYIARGLEPPRYGPRTTRMTLLQPFERYLRERVVESPDLADAAVLFGTGFAPFRGGPLHYARTRGVSAVVTRLEELAARYGARFRPDAGWVALGAAQKRDGA